MQKIYDLAKEVEQYVIDMRRYFHRHPELSDHEENTIARIAQELESMGIGYTIVPKGGILATIEGTDPGSGKTVLLRADVDALPVQEQPHNLVGPRTCVSEVPGVMHACGHDGHTAMLLGAAKILMEHRDAIHGKILLFFERGEENGGGQPYLLAYMDSHGIEVDTVYGTHLFAMLESGKVALITGGTMSTAMGFDVTIHGRGGHGSRPDQANSPIDCFVAIYNALSTLRLNKITPFETLTFSLGMLQAGAASNVIPNDLRFAGTARLFNREEVGLPFMELFKKKLEGIAAVYDCTVTYNMLIPPGFPVYNDPECTELARKAIGEELGEGAICQPEPWMASESFSHLQKLWPGVFALVGVKNEAKGIGAAHHNEYFDVDEEVFAAGVTGAVTYALKFLDAEIDTTPRRWKGSIRELLEMRATPEQVDGYYETVKD